MQTQFVMICSRDFWYRDECSGGHVWALLDAFGGDDITLYLISDRSAVFGLRHFASRRAAREALRSEGFTRLLEDCHAQATKEIPHAPFHLDQSVRSSESMPAVSWREHRHLAKSA